jgi:hypothetical protein
VKEVLADRSFRIFMGDVSKLTNEERVENSDGENNRGRQLNGRRIHLPSLEKGLFLSLRERRIFG